MKLREYFDRHCIHIRNFGKKAGLSLNTIYKILNGEEVLLSVALKIEQATEGAVKCSDMQPNEEYFKPPGGARKGRKAKDMSKPPEELSPPTPSQ